jgi:hypothetical protein
MPFRRPIRRRWAPLSAFPIRLEAAVVELTQGQRKAAMAALEADPSDRLAIALAGLGWAMGAI